jgi:1-acyl-sn-glycerol-3-phosphate acyltransferase
MRDRLLRALARGVARWFFRSVEVTGEADLRGPVIVAASHLNGFVDPVLLVSALGMLPRFLAKATLWRVPGARPLLALARVVPVHRREDSAGAGDGTGTAANTATFASAVAALDAGDTVAIFPEGTTHDRPHLVELRTGVARIAVQALDAGVAGVRILPVGIAYEDKVALRGRALVAFAPPVDVAAEVSRLRAAGADEHAVVRGLLATVGERLRSVSPDFPTLVDALALTGAASVALRDGADDPRRPVPLAASAPLARELGRLPEPDRSAVVDAQCHYQLALDHVGLRDEDVGRSVSATALARRVLVLAATILVLAPFAIAGAFANALPTAAVVVAGLIPEAPVTKGTVRVLVGLVAFPLTWLALAWFDFGGTVLADVTAAATFPLTPAVNVLLGNRSGFLASLLVFVSLPLLAFAALAVLAQVWALLGAWRSWRTVLDRRGQLDEMRVLRRAVITDVTAARGGVEERV